MYSVVVVQEVLQRKWESWRWGVQLPAIWEDHQSWSSYNYTRSTKELNIHHSIVIWHLKQIGKVKKLNKWVKKIIVLNNEPCLDWIVTFYEKWIVYTNRWPPAQWVVRLRRSSIALPKAKLAPKKGPGHCLVVCYWSDPLQLSYSCLMKPLHLRGKLSKSMSYTKRCNTCIHHWSTEWVQFFSMTVSNSTSHNQCFKSWMN